MSTYLYTCDYCHKEFVPTRRKVQRFCCASCRVGAHQKKKRFKNQLSLAKPIQKEDDLSVGIEKESLKQFKNKESNHNNSMNLGGVLNAFAGNALYDLGKTIIKSKATTPSNQMIEKSISKKRYILIKNIPLSEWGETPYFDTVTSELVYFKL